MGFGIKDAMARLWKEYGFMCKNPSLWRSSMVSSGNDVVTTMHVPPTYCISNICDANFNLTEDLIKLAVSNAQAAFHIGDLLLYT